MATHYDTLGLARGAPPEQIRRAYLDLARRYHPDRLGSASTAERVRAEARMRQVNEAWAVLGDPVRRAAYDRSLSGAVPAGGSLGGAAPTGPAGDAGARPRPPRRSPDEMPHLVDLRPTGAAHGSPGPLAAFLPIIVILAVLAVILVVTAYAGRDDDPGVDVDTAEPYPIGSCVAVVFSSAGAVEEQGAQARPSLVPVSCAQPGASQVVERVPVPVSCPAGSVAQVIPDTEDALCLAAP